MAAGSGETAARIGASKGREQTNRKGACVTCREVADFLMDYVSGELSGDRLRNFEDHFSICEACRIYLANYRATIDIGRSAFEDEDAAAAAAGVPEDLIKAILAARGR